jgi:hypothetical protein
VKHADWKDFKELESFLLRAIPPTVQARFIAHLELLEDLYQRDLDLGGYMRVFLINALEKKYPNAAKDFISATSFWRSLRSRRCLPRWSPKVVKVGGY